MQGRIKVDLDELEERARYDDPLYIKVIDTLFQSNGDVGTLHLDVYVEVLTELGVSYKITATRSVLEQI